MHCEKYSFKKVSSSGRTFSEKPSEIVDFSAFEPAIPFGNSYLNSILCYGFFRCPGAFLSAEERKAAVRDCRNLPQRKLAKSVVFCFVPGYATLARLESVLLYLLKLKLNGIRDSCWKKF